MKTYKAIGVCGMSNGIEIEGNIHKTDGWGVYLLCKRGIVHLCDKRTLKLKL